MKGKKSPSRKKKSVRKRRSRSPRLSRCKKLLQDKIKINIKEYEKGRYVSRKQAVAVSYSQIKKRHPSCRRSFRKRSK